MVLQICPYHLAHQPHELIRHRSGSTKFVLADLRLPNLNSSHQHLLRHNFDGVDLVKTIDEDSLSLRVEATAEASRGLEAKTFMSHKR